MNIYIMKEINFIPVAFTVLALAYGRLAFSLF